jgi:hypothetical protein
MRFHERCIMPDDERRRRSPGTLSVAYSAGIIEAAALRVNHVVGILEQTAVGMVGGMLLI